MMWARRRLDIGWADFLYAACLCLLPAPMRRARRIEERWAGAASALVCLSVRSGFDLLLRALQLPRGSEVLMSAVNVQGMFDIVRAHGLVAVPLDIDGDSLRPAARQLRAAVSPASRMLVAAHLFGAEAELAEVRAAARAHGLLVVEDRAQAFSGIPGAMPPNCDATLTSFGPIKRATALGGAVVAVRDARLGERMRRMEQRYARQSRARFARRLGKFALLRLASGRWTFAALVRLIAAAGRDGDAWLQGAARSFGAGGIEQLRRRPAAAQAALLARRIERFDAAAAARQRRRGAQLAARLGADGIAVAGCRAPRHEFDLFAVRARAPQRLIAHLRRHGFDAAMRGSLAVLDAPPGRAALEPAAARRMMAETVFLPVYDAMPDAEIERLAALLRGACSAAPRTAADPAQGGT